MGWRSTLAPALVAGLLSGLAGPQARAETSPLAGDCAAAVIHTFRASGVRDGTTIVTEEGALIRLAGIVVPGDLDGDANASLRAARALDGLVTGKAISVRGKTGNKDRYGRIAAQVEVAGEQPRWVQAAMLASGEARVAPQMESGDCTAALLRVEQQARLRGAGNWSDPRFTVHGSSDIAGLTAAEGRYMLVEGVVRRVGEAGGRLYLDFGSRFNEDFSVIVPREAHKAFTGAGIDLRSLGGVRLRVRGIVSVRGGPAIELRDPSAMELLKAGGA